MKKILQIIPADKWVALFKENDSKDSPEMEDNLICFALVETDEGTSVEGLCGSDTIDFCQDASNFLGYRKAIS